MTVYDNSQHEMNSNVDDNLRERKFSNVDPGALNIGSMGRFQSQQRILEELEITENQNERESYKKWREAYAVWKLCCSESSLPGVPNFINSDGKFFGLFWLVANVIGWSGFIIVLVFLSKEFSGFPTTVVVDVKPATSQQFPAVSVCNMNRVTGELARGQAYFQTLATLQPIVKAELLNLRKDRLNKPVDIPESECNEPGIYWCTDGSNCIANTDRCDGVKDCENNEDEIVDCPVSQVPTPVTHDNLAGGEMGILNYRLYNEIDWTLPDWFDAYVLSQYEDLHDLFPFTLMNRSLVEQVGVKKDDFIQSCTFDGETCSGDFFQFQNEKFGNCFTFNSPVDQSTGVFNTSAILTTGQTSPSYGLKLTLFVDESEYIGLLGQNTGVLVVLHSPLIEPDLVSNSFVASTGYETQVAITKGEINRLADPYSNCMKSFPSIIPIASNKTQYSYVKEVCDKYCFQYHLKRTCDCYDNYLVDTNDLCDYTNSTVAICKAKTEKSYMEGMLQCGCEQECNSDLYLKSFSTIAWPSSNYLPFFMAHSWERSVELNLKAVYDFWDDVMNDTTVDYGEILEEVRKNFVRLAIHFETLNYYTIDFQPSYPYYQFIADIGGYSGLFTGICVMTLFEFIDTFSKVGLVFCSRKRTKMIS